MTPTDKYQVLPADTAAAKKYHCILIEQALKASGLSPEFRAELEAKMKHVKLEEAVLKCAEDETNNGKKKKGKGDHAGDSGDSEDSGTGSKKKGGSGGGGGGVTKETNEESAESEMETENLAVLLYLAEKDVQQTSDRIGIPLAAATLLFNRAEKYARLHRPLMPQGLDSQAYMPTAFLATLEHHAASIGARMFQVRVHAEAVDMLKKQHGYEPVGEPVEHKGVTLQRMRKTLGQSNMPGVDPS